MRQNTGRRILSMLLVLAMMLSLTVGAFAATPSTADSSKPRIGISWMANDQDYKYMKHVIVAAGGIPVELDKVTSTAVKYDEKGMIDAKYLETTGMLKQTYADVVKSKDFSKSNIEAVMKDIDGVFFTGGEDISPSLFKVPVKVANMGEEINATRDISDYTLMAYCIEKDIPAFAVCRGEQMMGIVSGCTFLQDIPNYYKEMGKTYDDRHRTPVGTPNRDYARHDVDVFKMDSWLYKIVGDTSLKNISSWHHQAIMNIEGTGLIQTSKTTVDGIDIIEGVENPSKTYCVGVQFHPENDISSVLYEGKKAADYCDIETSLEFFKQLVKHASEKKVAAAKAA